MHPFKTPGVTALAVAVFLSASPAVYAFDKTGNTLADTFMNNLEAGGATDISVGSVTGDESRTEISGLKARIVGKSDGGNVDFGSIVIDDGSVEAGRLKAAKMTMENVSLVGDDGFKFTIESATATEVAMPSAEEIKAKPNAPDTQPKYKTAEIKNMTFTPETGVVIPVSSVVINLDDFVDNIPKTGTMSVQGIVINKDALDNEGKQALERFGYSEITLSLETAGKWDPDSGTVDVEKIKLSGDNVGTLTIGGTFGGFTKEVVEKLQNTEDPQMAMQALQGGSIQGLSIRIDNDSIVDRALAAQGKEMGGLDANAVAQQFSAALPLMLTALQNKDFEKMVAEKAGTFLRERKSIEAVAKPAQPVPFAQIMGAAMMAPQTLPNVLGVQLSNP